MKQRNMRERKDLRKQKNTYISLLYKVPNGKACRHTGLQSIRINEVVKHPPSVGNDEGLFFNKHCDAYQVLGCTRKEVIFGRYDLVEVFK